MELEHAHWVLTTCTFSLKSMVSYKAVECIVCLDVGYSMLIHKIGHRVAIMQFETLTFTNELL